MKVQLAIIGAILITGGFLFIPGSIDIIPGGQDMLDYIQNNVGEVSKQTAETFSGTAETISGTVDASLHTANGKINDIKDSSQNFLSKQAAPTIIPTKYEEDEFHGKLEEKSELPPAVSRRSNGVSSPQSTTSAVPTIVTTPQTQKISFETLSLVTEKQADNTVMLKYQDTSAKTLSVTVTMRNDAKTLFTGQFFSSSFEAVVLDSVNTPYFIDMIVEHADHGMISASAFNPEGNTDSMINGVFSSSG